MTIDFNCQKCEGSFELDAEDLIEGTEKLVCPHCDNKAAVSMVDDFTSALSELRAQVAALSKKFAVSLAVETEDVEEEVEEDEDADADEEGEDDDELDLDEDDDDVDDEDEDELEDEDLDDR
jgi:DNA-directed RNA polymerase subunit RPC12/RpoP